MLNFILGVFVSLSFTTDIAQQAIDSWNHEITSTRSIRVPGRCQDLLPDQSDGVENFANYPRRRWSTFSGNAASSRHIVASVPANELHPFK